MSEVAAATVGVPEGGLRHTERAYWKKSLAPYARPHLGRSAFDLLTSVVPYFALSYVMYLLLDVNYLYSLAVGVPAAGFRSTRRPRPPCMGSPGAWPATSGRTGSASTRSCPAGR